MARPGKYGPPVSHCDRDASERRTNAPFVVPTSSRTSPFRAVTCRVAGMAVFRTMVSSPTTGCFDYRRLLNPDRPENQYGWREPLLLDRLLLNPAHGVGPEHDASEARRAPSTRCRPHGAVRCHACARG